MTRTRTASLYNHCHSYDYKPADTCSLSESNVSIQNRSTRQSAMRVIGTARIICGAGSMELSGVHPSVCLSYLAAVTAGLLL